MKTISPGRIIQLSVAIGVTATLTGCAVTTSTEGTGSSISSQTARFQFQRRVGAFGIRRGSYRLTSPGRDERQTAIAEHRTLVRSQEIRGQHRRWVPDSTDPVYREMLDHRAQVRRERPRRHSRQWLVQATDEGYRDMIEHRRRVESLKIRRP